MRNVIGNHWEHGGNIKIVGKNLKPPTSKPRPLQKEKNWALGMLVTPSHWSDEIFILELFITIFSFGLIRRMLYLPPAPPTNFTGSKAILVPEWVGPDSLIVMGIKKPWTLSG
jgi:hypothetical protein